MTISVLRSLQEKFFNKPASKRFYCPARIHWGYDAFEIGIDMLSGCTALVFVDRNLLDSEFQVRLSDVLAQGTEVVSVNGPPSPERVLDLTRDRTHSPSVVIALGGGSTIDTAKTFIAQIRFGNIDGLGMGERRGIAPIAEYRPLFIAFPSTAGTGAETSRYYVTYADKDHKKIHGKNWDLIADWVFLAPQIANTAPARVKYESALDAFVHACESHLCQEEESWVNSSICLGAIRELRLGLDLLNNDVQSLEGMLRLLSASSLGGVAISNVRTGHLHEMAGALLEYTGLNHPQSLSVFLKEGTEILEGSPIGAQKLAQIAAAFNCRDWQDVLGYWSSLLNTSGIAGIIRNRISALSQPEIKELRAAVEKRTMADVVWNTKECPVKITPEVVDTIFHRSISNALFLPI
jgi:alcohol dehydrogenase class IV